MKRHLLPLLACPACGEGLDFEGASSSERLVCGLLLCNGCAARYQILDEMPILVDRGLSAGEWQWEVDVSELQDFDSLRAAYNSSLPDQVRSSQPQIIAHILSAVSTSAGPVLDIATGMGTLFRPLATSMSDRSARAGQRDCLATDVDERVLRGTQRKLRQEGHAPGASLLVSDVKHLALRDEMVGAVVSFGGFANVSDGGKALCEAARVLQDGGILAFSTLLLREESPSFRLAAENGYGDLMSFEHLQGAVEAAGLSLVEQRAFVSGIWPGCPYDMLPLEGDWFAHAVFTARKQGPLVSMSETE